MQLEKKIMLCKLLGRFGQWKHQFVLLMISQHNLLSSASAHMARANGAISFLVTSKFRYFICEQKKTAYKANLAVNKNAP